MKFLMLLKDMDVKTLNTGDKSARILLETLDPKDIPQLLSMGDAREIWVDFQIDNTDRKD